MLFMVVSLSMQASMPAEAVALGFVETSRIVLVANGPDRTLQSFGVRDLGGEAIWTRAGTAHPSLIVANPNGSEFAVLDMIENLVLRVRIDGAVERIRVPESPLDARFEGNALYVLCRDARRLLRIDGANRIEAETDIDPLLAASDSNSILLYSRVTGSLRHYDARDLVLGRDSTQAAFAVDAEASEGELFLTFPQLAEVHVISRKTLSLIERIKVGAVPTDTVIESSTTLLRTGLLNTADPSSKRTWETEQSQSTSRAFAQGFLQGFLGLGLIRPSSKDFPNGVDRIARGTAYDSSTGTLYRVTKKSVKRLSTGIPPRAWVSAQPGIIYWDPLTRSVKLDAR